MLKPAFVRRAIWHDWYESSWVEFCFCFILQIIGNWGNKSFTSIIREIIFSNRNTIQLLQLADFFILQKSHTFFRDEICSTKQALKFFIAFFNTSLFWEVNTGFYRWLTSKFLGKIKGYTSLKQLEIMLFYLTTLLGNSYCYLKNIQKNNSKRGNEKYDYRNQNTRALLNSCFKK